MRSSIETINSLADRSSVDPFDDAARLLDSWDARKPINDINDGLRARESLSARARSLMEAALGGEIVIEKGSLIDEVLFAIVWHSIDTGYQRAGGDLGEDLG